MRVGRLLFLVPAAPLTLKGAVRHSQRQRRFCQSPSLCLCVCVCICVLVGRLQARRGASAPETSRWDSVPAQWEVIFRICYFYFRPLKSIFHFVRLTRAPPCFPSSSFGSQCFKVSALKSDFLCWCSLFAAALFSDAPVKGSL